MAAIPEVRVGLQFGKVQCVRGHTWGRGEGEGGAEVAGLVDGDQHEVQP